MKSLNEHIYENNFRKSEIFEKMIIYPKQVSEKLVINKNFRSLESILKSKSLLKIATHDLSSFEIDLFKNPAFIELSDGGYKIDGVSLINGKCQVSTYYLTDDESLLYFVYDDSWWRSFCIFIDPLTEDDNGKLIIDNFIHGEWYTLKEIFDMFNYYDDYEKQILSKYNDSFLTGLKHKKLELRQGEHYLEQIKKFIHEKIIYLK